MLLASGCWSNADPEPAAPGASRKEKRVQGRWRKAPDDAVIEQLQKLGYLEGTRPAPGFWGVATHDAASVPGWNLYTSGHAPGAWLMDAKGNLVHSWRAPWRALFPKDPVAEDNPAARYWRRVALLDDGGVVAVFEGLGVVRLSHDSTVVWARDNDAHHDLQVVGSDLWLLTRTAHVVRTVHPTIPVLEDFVVKLDLATGEETGRWSLVRAMEKVGPVVRTTEPGHEGDLLHTNSLEVLDAAGAAALEGAEAGDILVSMLAVDTVAVLHPDTETIVWSQRGPWKRQHDPHVVDGELLVFDNLGGHGGNSRLLRVPLQLLDGEPPSSPPATWTWKGDPSESFSTAFCGIAQELPGGNVLATESCHGRVIEIDPATGDVVWEYVSERVAGEDNELIAALFEVRRVPRPAWLSR